MKVLPFYMNKLVVNNKMKTICKVWLDSQCNFRSSKTWAKNVIYLSNSHIQMRSSSTSLLEPASFHKTTFQPKFFKFLEKNSCIIWLGNMKSSNVMVAYVKNLKWRTQHSLTHTLGFFNCLFILAIHIWKSQYKFGFLQLSFHSSHSHLKITIQVCSGP